MASQRINHNELLKMIDPQTVGILWFSDESLAERPWPFHTLDYLMDGLLARYTKQEIEQKNGDGKTVFVSQQFQHSFFIGHFQKTTGDLGHQVSQTLQVIEQSKSAKKVLIIAPKKLDQIKKIKEKLKGLEVELVLSE